MSSSQHCIYLVEDDSISSFCTLTLFRILGIEHALRRFDYAEEALNELKKNQALDYAQPNLILLDINLPMMNGWDFLEELQLPDSLSHIPVALCTSSIDSTYKSKAEDYDNVVQLIQKPLTVGRLKEVLSTTVPALQYSYS
jgi:CheY-like chemotaxis protein